MDYAQCGAEEMQHDKTWECHPVNSRHSDVWAAMPMLCLNVENRQCMLWVDLAVCLKAGMTFMCITTPAWHHVLSLRNRGVSSIYIQAGDGCLAYRSTTLWCKANGMMWVGGRLAPPQSQRLPWMFLFVDLLTSQLGRCLQNSLDSRYIQSQVKQWKWCYMLMEKMWCCTLFIMVCLQSQGPGNRTLAAYVWEGLFAFKCYTPLPISYGHHIHSCASLPQCGTTCCQCETERSAPFIFRPVMGLFTAPAPTSFIFRFMWCFFSDIYYMSLQSQVKQQKWQYMQMSNMWFNLQMVP